MSGKRPYRKKVRAASQEETRLRIVEATMRLHEEIGPRATTISAIAEEAGVQRLTVYRHFPDETAVFRACTAHWLGLNPPPDPATWLGIDGAEARLRAALEAFYSYYRGTRRMWQAAHRDVDEVPALQEPMAQFAGFIDEIAETLSAGLGLTGRPASLAGRTIRHALAFSTWLEMEMRQIDQGGKVDLVLTWISGASAAD